MRIKKLDENFYELSDESKNYWTINDSDKDNPFIMNADCNTVKPTGVLGKKLIKALNEWLAARL